jgi:diadenosine tetraphosphatase ApaH/serine/threonine PP2A family protein phosphatase
MHDTIELADLVNVTCQILLRQTRRDCTITDVCDAFFFARFFASACKVLRRGPSLVRLTGLFVVVGDLHGNVDDLIRIFQRHRYPPATRYVFLGDFVDRGRNSFEVLALLFALLQLYPQDVCLLRGNHETRPVTKLYGFPEDVISRCSVPVYESIVDCFEAMPIAAVLNDRVLCVHGGISQFCNRLSELDSELRDNLVADLIWSDPREGVDRFATSARRMGHFFSRDALERFLDANGLQLMIRAHSFQPRGFAWNFGEAGRCLTVFSSSGYEGRGNCGAVAIVGEDVRTEVIPPMTEAMLLRRRILVPSWALAASPLIMPQLLVPDVYGPIVH